MCHGESRYWFRQSFVVLAICMQSLSNGIMLAFPSVLNPALLDPNSKDIRATNSQVSWLASVIGISGVVGFATLSPIMQIYGRRTVHIIKNVVVTIAWIIFYNAESISVLFVARLVQGIGMGGIFINMIIIGEYTSPSRRGYFTAMQKFAISCGTLICHLMAIWFTWRQVVATAIAMPVTGLFLTMFWPESPFFLAMRGRYDDCEKSFHWLNGTVSRNTELQELVADQKRRREERVKTSNTKKIMKQMMSPDFRKSFGIVCILMFVIDFSGRNYFKGYVVQIMMYLLGDKSLAVYISVGSDLSVLTALLISGVFVRCFKRRVLLFSFGALTISNFLIISLILYLKSNNIITVWPWLIPVLILLTNFLIHVGLSPTCYIIMGEIFPLEVKGLGCCLSGMVFTLSYGTVMKLTLVLMENVGLDGMYVIYSIVLIVCFVILYYILPETMNRPLLHIEKGLKEVKGDHTGVTLLKQARSEKP